MIWSQEREHERQASVGRWLDTACTRARWEDDELVSYLALREKGLMSDAVCALIDAGDLHTRQADFWEAVQRAAELLWIDHPWATTNPEHTKRMQYLRGLENRIKGWDC